MDNFSLTLNWGFVVLWAILLLLDFFCLYHWLRFAHPGFWGRLIAYFLFAISFLLAFVSFSFFFLS